MDRVELNQRIKGKQDDDWLFQDYEEVSDSPEQCLNSLRDFKQLSNFANEQIQKIQKKLTFFRDTGSLDYLKNKDGVVIHNDTMFSFIEGRTIHDYSNCAEVMLKKAQLKEAENTARAVGATDEKKSAPAWRVTPIKEKN
jgi:hypothetical protein